MANFNVDTNGNLWIGTNVSNNFSTAQGQSDTKFYVTNAGAIHAESGDIGGIVVDADGVESSNFDAATNTGWRLDNSAGIAQYFDIDIQLSSAASDTPSTGSTTLDIGSTQIYENNDDLFINTSGTTNFVNIRDRLKLTSTSSSGSNMQLMFDGVSQNDAMGFRHVVNGAINSGDADLIWTNQSGASDYNNIAYVTTTDDYFHLGSDAPGIKTDYTGSPTFYFDGPGSPGSDSATFNMAVRPYAIKDKDGQVGSSGQVLSSTGSRIDWIDLPSGNDHPDSDHNFDNFDHIDINNLEMRSGYGLTISAGSGISVSSSSNPHTITIANTAQGSSGITSINSQTGSAITITSGFSNSGSPYVGVGGFSSNSNTISLGRSTQARCNILDPHSSSPKVGNSTSDRFSNIYSQSFYGTFYGQNINASSRNIKENIVDTALGLDFINDLTVKDFTMIDTDTFGTQKYIGFIAEDIEDYLSENNLDYKLTEDYSGNYEFKDKCSHIVYCENDNFNCEEDCCSEYFRRDRGEGIVEMYLHETVEDCEAYMPDENRHPHLYFNNFIGPLVKAVQELSTQISDLTARIEVLEG